METEVDAAVEPVLGPGPGPGPKTASTRVTTWPARADTPALAWIAQYGVRVAPSTIVGAGKGVFAVVDLPAKRVLGWYRGVLLTQAQFDALYGPAPPTYVLDVGRGKYVDAVDTAHRNWTAMVNDARGTGRRPNCVFTAAGSVKTTRPIKAGEELFISYGAGYWEEE